jgi:hypothetical protein
MNSEVLRGEARGLVPRDHERGGVEARVLRSQLVNLTLDWELTALALDAQRYRAADVLKRESLRESASAIRKCVAELTKVLSGSALLACKP